MLRAHLGVSPFQAAISFSHLPKIPHEHPPKQTFGLFRSEFLYSEKERFGAGSIVCAMKIFME